MIRFISAAALSALLVVAAPQSGWAQAQAAPSRPGSQQGPGQGREMTRDEMVERVRGNFNTRMASELRLTPEQSTALLAVFTEFDGPRREIAAQKRRLHGEANSTLRGVRSEDRARTLLAEFARVREREATLLREEEVRLLQVLSPSQVLALQIFREQLGDQIRGATNPFSQPSSAPFGGSNSPRSFPQGNTR
jgi:Spy/CpxP family protein refolding chaperone